MPPPTLYRPQWEFTADQIKRVALPKLIPCSSCQKNKGHNQYSNKQLNDLRHKVKRQGGGKIDAKNSVRCRECTGSQPQEMYCIECREIKELKKFALAQRKHPDNAKCILCMEAQELVLPENRVYETGSRRAPECFDDEDEDEDDDVIPTRYGKKVWEMDTSGQYLVGGDDSSQHASSASNPWASEYASSNPDSNSYSKKKGHAAVQSTSSASTSKLTAGNLTNLNIANRFAKISLMEKEIDDSSSSGSECASTIRGNDDLPNVKAAPNGGHVQSEWVSNPRVVDEDSSSEDEEEEERRPAPISRRAAREVYTAVDAHGKHHQIDAQSESSYSLEPAKDTKDESDSVITRSSTASKSSFKTVGSGFKYKYGAFRKPDDERNPRKFARVRPENMDPARAKENLLARELAAKEYKKSKGRVRDDPGSDEEW